MGTIKSILSTIINYGINQSLSEKKKKRVRITNILALTTAILVLPLFFVFQNIGANFLKSLIPGVVVYQMYILILNKKGFINLSRFIAPNANALVIFIYSTSLGQQTLFYLFYFPAISGSFLYFELKEKRFFAFQLFFSSTLIFVDLFSKVRPFPVFEQSLESAVFSSYFFTLAALSLFLVCLFALAAESSMAEDSLIKAKQCAETATRAKSNFLAKMSHEIRTPMNAVIGMTHLVLSTKLSLKQQDYMNKIQASSQALLGIINEILDFSKIEADRMTIENIKFNLRTVLELLGNTINIKAEKKGIEILFSIDERISNWMKGDPLKLGQVLINLADNAVKFSSGGYVKIFIELINVENNTIRFTVEDQGIGLSSDQLPNIFKSFYQADDSITRKYGGTGLGLSISKQLVELMGGKLNVESVFDKGTEFYFDISFELVPGMDEEHTGIFPLKNLHGFKVLLVEDNLINQQIISELVELLGLDYDLAVNGRQGYQMACKNTYDLVLMDIQMPEMDGLEATKHIRDYGLMDLPIIAMSANVMDSDKEKSLQAGMNGYITKPIDPEELNRVLLKFIQPMKVEKKNPIIITKKTIDSNNIKMPIIEGLDVDMGLSRVRGSEKLYLKLLKEYSNLYKNATGDIKSFLDNSEIDKARHFAHSLKGASGMLGMLIVSTIYSNIESSLINKEIIAALKHLSANNHILVQIINDLNNYFSNIDLSLTNKTVLNDKNPLNLSKLREKIDLLVEACHERDSMALDVAEQVKTMLLETSYIKNIDKIIYLIEDIEFKKASELALNLIKNIEV